jgi:hypothetical protein
MSSLCSSLCATMLTPCAWPDSLRPAVRAYKAAVEERCALRWRACAPRLGGHGPLERIPRGDGAVQPRAQQPVIAQNVHRAARAPLSRAVAHPTTRVIGLFSPDGVRTVRAPLSDGRLGGEVVHRQQPVRVSDNEPALVAARKFAHGHCRRRYIHVERIGLRQPRGQVGYQPAGLPGCSRMPLLGVGAWSRARQASACHHGETAAIDAVEADDALQRRHQDLHAAREPVRHANAASPAHAAAQPRF